MFFPQNFWIKTISNILMLLYLLKFKSNELYFYYNLGIRRVHLLIFTFTLDYLIFLACFYFSGILVRLNYK
jgi:hypothetical protein